MSCPKIKEMVGSKPDDISTWIVTEVDQHTKCIIKSEATKKYLEALEEYSNNTNKDTP